MKPERLEIPDDLFEPLPRGPLDTYRKQASFDWKQLKHAFKGKGVPELEKTVINFLRSDPIFSMDPSDQRLADVRALNLKRMYKFLETELMDDYELFENPSKIPAYLFLCALVDTSISMKSGMTYFTPRSVILNLGSRQHDKILNALDNGEISFAFCLTEIAHGTNTKAMQTRATYDITTNEFVILTPRMQDAKCWAANLGQSATHALLFAQLYTPDGQNHGLHNFIVPMRDPKTLLPYPGITIGDMGDKLGLNGVDNGFVIFNNYRIPKEYLLNKNGDVSYDGLYVPRTKDESKRFGSQLQALSDGRIFIIGQTTDYLKRGITIAIRYGAVRTQFGPDGSDEQPLLDYQLHQWRLIPYLASVYVHSNFHITIFKTMIATRLGKFSDSEMREVGAELHAISCCGKSLAGWVMRDGIQECREACGGHGYLKISGIPDLKNDSDACLTYEGDNNVILQQASNYLLGLVNSGTKVKSVMGTTDFINDFNKILRTKYESRHYEDIMTSKMILTMYEWLLCYLIKASSQKLKEENSKGKDSFTSRNDCQVYYLRNLSLAYAQYCAIKMYFDFVRSEEVPKCVEHIMQKMGVLYGIWSLEKHIPTFVRGEYFKGPEAVDHIQKSILHLCDSLKMDAVSLVDVIAPPDELFNTVLGKSDGEIYKHLMSAMIQRPGALGRPEYWKDVVNRPIPKSVKLNSKL